MMINDIFGWCLKKCIWSSLNVCCIRSTAKESSKTSPLKLAAAVQLHLLHTCYFCRCHWIWLGWSHFLIISHFVYTILMFSSLYSDRNLTSVSVSHNIFFLFLRENFHADLTTHWQPPIPNRIVGQNVNCYDPPSHSMVHTLYTVFYSSRFWEMPWRCLYVCLSVRL